MILNSDTFKQLADEVLTFIEQREAEQVAYGVYDVTMTGAEVIDSFQPSEDIPLAAEQKTKAISEALQQLGNDLQIIRFNQADSPTEWVFQTKISRAKNFPSRAEDSIYSVVCLSLSTL